MEARWHAQPTSWRSHGIGSLFVLNRSHSYVLHDSTRLRSGARRVTLTGTACGDLFGPTPPLILCQFLLYQFGIIDASLPRPNVWMPIKRDSVALSCLLRLTPLRQWGAVRGKDGH